MRDGEPLATVLPLYQVSFDFGAEALDSVERYNKLSDSLAGLLGNYFAKEGYSIDKWPEAQFVVSYGGKAVVLKRVDGYSTSSMVDRLNAKGGR